MTGLNQADVNTAEIYEIIKNYDVLINEVFSKIRSVHDIANKTNLLAINASIETIHASDLLASFEQIVEDNLKIQGRLLADILTYDPDFLGGDGVAFAKVYGLEEVSITDEEGTIQFTNMPAWKNTRLNSGELLKILKNQDMEVSLPSKIGGMGGLLYKTVGIGRKDKGGIVQIGTHYNRPKGQEAINGFGIVAKEAKRLADEAKILSSKISDVTNELYHHIKELITLTDHESRQNSDELNPVELSVSQLSTLDEAIENVRKKLRGSIALLVTLINIARQTNLLGIRAAIESAHSTNDKQDFDQILNKLMVVEARLVSYLLCRAQSLSDEDMANLSAYSGIAEFWITDEQGVVEYTNIIGSKGFTFKHEGQTAPFMVLLTNPDTVVTAPPAMRAADSKVFKYVGVGRKDKPGIIQIGKASKLYGESTAKGFSVVSSQIKILAEQSRAVATEIQDIFERMDTMAQKVQEGIRRF